jgi:hypothetical protein
MSRRICGVVCSVALALGSLSCGGGGATTPTPQRAAISIPTMTVAGQRGESGYSYLVRLTLTNTGGVSATLTSATFTLVFAGTTAGLATVPVAEAFGTTTLGPGASANSAILNLNDPTAPNGYATGLLVTIEFTDAQGANSATRTVAVPPLTTP